MDLIERSATELRRMMMAADVSPCEVTAAFIGQIERTDREINAFTVTCFDEARRVAKTIEDTIRRGENAGVLAGLPIAIKDMSYVKGLRATSGSPIYADFVPDRDDLVVQFIREEGGVIVGKTNTTPPSP